MKLKPIENNVSNSINNSMDTLTHNPMFIHLFYATNSPYLVGDLIARLIKHSLRRKTFLNSLKNHGTIN